MRPTLHLPKPADLRTHASVPVADEAPVISVELHKAPTACAPVSSSDLLQGRRSVEITHNGSVYRLSATRMGKLILTK